MSGSIQVGDVGTVIEVLCKDHDGAVLNISAATAMKIAFKKPGGEVEYLDAAFTTDGEDGLMQIVVAAGFLSRPGEWGIQGYLVLPAWQGHLTVSTVTVLPNLSTSLPE